MPQCQIILKYGKVDLIFSYNLSGLSAKQGSKKFNFFKVFGLNSPRFDALPLDLEVMGININSP